MPALSIDIDLSGVRDPKPSSRTRPLVKTFNGKQYGGFAHTHAYSTAKGRATYEFEAVGRRVESKEFELYVAAPMQSELRLEHADDATVTDAATGNQLNKPYKLNPGHSHLTVRLSVPATQSSPAKGSGGGT